MSEDWDSGGSGAKKGIPKWIWFCGGGCLLMIIFMVVVAFLVVGWAKDGADVEKQWPAVEEVLQFDERHPDYTLVWGNRVPFLGYEIYTFTQNDDAVPEDAAKLTAILMQFPSGKADEAAQSTDAEQADGAATEIKVQVQGRELSGIRMVNEGGGSPVPGMGAQESGAMAILQLSDAEDTEPVILMLMRSNSKTEVSDEDIVQFLAPFHVGPER